MVNVSARQVSCLTSRIKHRKNTSYFFLYKVNRGETQTTKICVCNLHKSVDTWMYRQACNEEEQVKESLVSQ